jgi:cell wall assembly regulator SMI1
MTANVALKKLIADVVALVPRASVNSPASLRHVDAIQQKLAVRFSEDVLAFYSIWDGFEEPTDLEHGWTQLWRLSEWKPVSQVCSVSPSLQREPIVFADHSLSS